MLRLKRLKKDSNVSIQIREKPSFFEGSFKRAFCISFIIHIAVFGVFRVKFLEIHEVNNAFEPIEVAIHEDEIQKNSVAQVAPHEEEDVYPMFLPKASLQNQVPEFHSDDDKELVSFLLNHSYISDPMKYANGEDLASSIFQNLENEKLVFSPRYYPLKVRLSPSLEVLKIVEDGLSLFREKKGDEKKINQKLNSSQYNITYGVKISGATGKIVEWTHKSLLRDKKLQSYADVIIQHIVFAPFSKKHIKGKIELSFECTGQELMYYLSRSLS